MWLCRPVDCAGRPAGRQVRRQHQGLQRCGQQVLHPHDGRQGRGATRGIGLHERCWFFRRMSCVGRVDAWSAAFTRQHAAQRSAHAGPCTMAAGRQQGAASALARSQLLTHGRPLCSTALLLGRRPAGILRVHRQHVSVSMSLRAAAWVKGSRWAPRCCRTQLPHLHRRCCGGSSRPVPLPCRASGAWCCPLHTPPASSLHQVPRVPGCRVHHAGLLCVHLRA